MTVADAPECIRLGGLLHQESRYRHLPYEPQRLGVLAAHCLGSDDCLALVMEDEEGICGMFVAFIQTHFFSSATYACDLLFYLKPARRGRMTAPRVIRRYVEWAKERGCAHIEIGVSSGVTPERTGRLYERLGFVPCGTLYIFNS